jgi:hypothetical protein
MSHYLKPSSVTNYLSGICQQLEPYFPKACKSPHSLLVHRTLKGCLCLKGTLTKRKKALTFSDSNSSSTTSPTQLNMTTSCSLQFFSQVSLHSCAWANFVFPMTPTSKIGKKSPSVPLLLFPMTNSSFSCPHTKLTTSL